jgi:hypothetical protein
MNDEPKFGPNLQAKQDFFVIRTFGLERCRVSDGVKFFRAALFFCPLDLRKIYLPCFLRRCISL